MKLIIIFLLTFLVESFASENHSKKDHEEGHEETSEISSGVSSFHDETGEFTLKDHVIKNFGIKSIPLVKKNGLAKVPYTSIVRSLSSTAVFLRKDGEFRSVPVVVLQTDKNFLLIKISAEITNEQVVTIGANFLKTIYLSLEEGPSEGHGH